MLQAIATVTLERIQSVTDSIESIRNHCLIPGAMKHWKTQAEKYDKNSGIIDDMDWDCFGTAVGEMDAYRRRFVSKHTTGWCGVGRKLKQWNFEQDDRCPRCKEADERAEHVWVCPAATTQQLWDTKMDDVETWMTSVQTAPELVAAILEGFNAWRAGRRRSQIKYRLRGLNQALAQQDRIGWKHAFEGK